jgi:endonuclease/exonuclease/phosphatase family metal-dependent hydrolase
MVRIRKFSRKLFIISNGTACFFFLLACCNAFLHPGRWWIISLLGLIFPYLFLIVLGHFVFGLFFRSCRVWSFLSLAVLLIGWTNIHIFLAFHRDGGVTTERPPHSLRVLTWNVRSWDEFITRKGGASGHRAKMMEFIDQQQPDILCLQEFFESHNPKEFPPNIPYIRDRLHFPYYFFSRDYHRYDGVYEEGVIIFSRYPIVDTALQHFSRSGGLRATESLISADIDVNGQKVRIYTTHLQSVLFHSKEYHDLEIIRNVDDSIFQASRSIIKKLRDAYRSRGDQAEQVRAQLDLTPYPSVICGDFNDVPNSYTYSTIRGKWQDAYISKGFGIGRTYVHLSPTLRIDYIMATPSLPVLRCSKFALPYSDHHPVEADLQLP